MVFSNVKWRHVVSYQPCTSLISKKHLIGWIDLNSRYLLIFLHSSLKCWFNNLVVYPGDIWKRVLISATLSFPVNQLQSPFITLGFIHTTIFCRCCDIHNETTQSYHSNALLHPLNESSTLFLWCATCSNGLVNALFIIIWHISNMNAFSMFTKK